MASQVLSGSSGVNYTNNTGQNVRVVINFMSSIGASSSAGRGLTTTNSTETLTISWAGVSQTYLSRGTVTSDGRTSTGQPAQPTAIGRNLASVSVSYSYSTDIVINGSPITTGGLTAIGVAGYNLLPGGSDSLIPSITTFNVSSSTNRAAPVSVALAANNASGTSPLALPTEIMLAPNQTFSAVCGVYNIVVIPEAG